MESFLFMAALGVLVLPIISIIVALSANSRNKRMERRLELISAKLNSESRERQDLASRLQAIENNLGTEGVITPSTVMSKDIPAEKISEPAPEPETSSDTEEIPSEERPTEELNIAAQERSEEIAEEEIQDEPQIAASLEPEQVDTSQSKSDFESKVGGRWSILLGGFALALGLVFMVQYSIEAGLLGPGPRVIMGALFSAALFGAGEWLRRSDRDFDLPVYATADVPGILTGAGAIGAFATLYAAHALYGFVGPGIAFVGMTVIGIATMMLSSIHGPKLAAIGVLGAYVAPMLVDSRAPNPMALALHVITVTAVVMAIARLRQWTWLAIAASLFSFLWIMLAAISTTPSSGLAGTLMVLAIIAIFVVAYGLHEFKNNNPEDTKTNWVINLTFTLLTLGFIIQLAANQYLPETATALGAAIILMAGAALAPSLATLCIHASIIVLITLLTARLDFTVIQGINTTSDLRNGIIPPDTMSFVQTAFLLCLPPALIAIWGSWRSINITNKHSGWLASAVSALAFFALLFTYLRIAPFETRPVIGSIGIAITALLVLLSEAFGKRAGTNLEAPSPAAFLVGTVSCLSLSIAIGINLGWLPLAFSLTALGVAGIYTIRPFTIIPWLSLAAGLCAGIALWFNMPLEYPTISSTLIFNGLIILLGIPALCLIFAGELMRFTQQGEVDVPANALTAIGLAVFGLFIAVEVVHIINGGDLINARQSLAETSGHAIASLFLAFGLRRLAKATGETVFTYASLTASAISVGIITLGLLVTFNPYLSRQDVGTGLVFNLLLPAYLLTGIASAAVALYSRGNAPRWYTLMYASLSGILFFTYASLMLRKVFQGASLTFWNKTTDLEFWLYSPLWLGLGAIILAVGLRYNSQIIRAASGILIMVTILKVFLLDMAQLEGFLKAISFIGLGISLIVVGRFYQRLLTRAERPQTI